MEAFLTLLSTNNLPATFQNVDSRAINIHLFLKALNSRKHFDAAMAA